MGSKTDDLKGRAKEALGALTGDENMKREGKADQSAAKVKKKSEEVVDRIRETTSND